MTPTRLERLLYGEAPARRLGLLRVGVGLYWVVRLLRSREKVAALVRVDPEHWAPEGVAVWLPGPPPGERFDVLWALTIGAGVLWTLGLGWRVVAPLFAALLLFVMSYRLSWGQLHHEAHLPTLHVLALACTPAAAAVSLDARLRGRRWARALATTTDDPITPSWRWGWPVRLVCLVTVATYTAAGVAKLTGSAGAGWGHGANLLAQVGFTGLHQEFLASGALPSVAFLYRHPELVGPLGLLTLVLEAGAAVALLDRRIGWIWAVGVCAMHWGIRGVMGIEFPYPLSGMAFLSFFPLERLLAFRRAGGPPAPPAASLQGAAPGSTQITPQSSAVASSPIAPKSRSASPSPVTSPGAASASATLALLDPP